MGVSFCKNVTEIVIPALLLRSVAGDIECDIFCLAPIGKDFVLEMERLAWR